MASKGKKGGFSKAQAKSLVKDLGAQLSKFQKSVKQLQADVNQLQQGGQDGPFWNGDLAYDWVKHCLGHIDHDKVLLDHIDNCYEYLDALINGGSTL